MFLKRGGEVTAQNCTDKTSGNEKYGPRRLKVTQRYGHFLSLYCDAKPFTSDPGVGLDLQCHNSALPIPTCWYLKMLKFALPPTQALKFALPPTPIPNASQWNIAKFSCWPCTFFLFLMAISFMLGPVFQWNMGFKLDSIIAILTLSNSHLTILVFLTQASLV